MSKHKGLSLEEKRSRMLQIFHEKREFFTLKEIEKIATKEKGIVLQSVKDVLQALVDDGIVKTDKIGTIVFFWAFPGDSIPVLEKKISDIQMEIQNSESQFNQIIRDIEKLKAGNHDLERSKQIICEIDELKKHEETLKEQIKKYADMDPDLINSIKEKSQVFKVATNTWTDNIYAVQSYCKKMFNIETKDLNKQFQISEDLDYIN